MKYSWLNERYLENTFGRDEPSVIQMGCQAWGEYLYMVGRIKGAWRIKSDREQRFNAAAVVRDVGLPDRVIRVLRRDGSSRTYTVPTEPGKTALRPEEPARQAQADGGAVRFDGGTGQMKGCLREPQNDFERKYGAEYDYLGHGILWRGWIPDRENVSLVGQWLAWPGGSDDQQRFFYSSYPGGAGRYSGGDHFEIEPRPGQVVVTAATPETEKEQYKQEALDRLLELLDTL